MKNRHLLSTALAAAAVTAVITVSTSAIAAPLSSPQTNDPRSAKTAPSAPAAPAAPTQPAAPGAARTVRHSFSLAASAFAPDGLHQPSEDYFNQWAPPALANTDSGRCFNAGLALPTGITLKSVKAYYTQGSAPMFFELIRQDLADNSSLDIASFDSTVAATPEYTSTSEAIPAADAAVDYTRYAYSAGVCPSGNATFAGITITYTEPAS